MQRHTGCRLYKGVLIPARDKKSIATIVELCFIPNRDEVLLGCASALSQLPLARQVRLLHSIVEYHQLCTTAVGSHLSRGLVEWLASSHFRQKMSKESQETDLASFPWASHPRVLRNSNLSEAVAPQCCYEQAASRGPSHLAGLISKTAIRNPSTLFTRPTEFP